MFNILNLSTNEVVLNDDGEPLEFATGADAARHAKLLSDSGTKYQPRKVGPADKNWREREARRIADGTYKRPDYLGVLEAQRDHYLHLAEKRPGDLAYTKDTIKGETDVQTVISFQGYVEAFRKGTDPKWLASLREQHEASTRDDDGLKFASEPDDIVEVYTNYDHDAGAVSVSCMRYPEREFKRESGCPQHPVYVYGAGDLAVAYLERDGATCARALCWPEKKVYTRVYGEGGLLHTLLQKRGFKKSAYYYGGDVSTPSLKGARLLRIEHPDDSDIFLAPYVDDVCSARDTGKYLILDPGGDIDLHRTDGWTDAPRERYTCDCCESSCDDLTEVYIGRSSSRSYCESCANDAFLCDRTGAYYDPEYVRSYGMADGETWCEFAYEDHGGECARTEEYYPADELIAVIVDDYGATEEWGPNAVERHTWRCQKTDSLYSDDVEPVVVYITEGARQEWGNDVAEVFSFVSEVDGRRYANQLKSKSGRRVPTFQEGQPSQANPPAPKRPKLSLKGDHPGQMRLPLQRRHDGQGHLVAA